MEQDTKVCRRCEQPKPVESFSLNNCGNRRGTCSDCRRGKPKPRPCQRCGQVFQPKTYENSSHCSRSCAALDACDRKATGTFSPIPFRPCVQCGHEFYRRGSGQLCSEECRKAKARIEYRAARSDLHSPQSAACIECGQGFTYSRYSRPTIICSKRCARRRKIRLDPDGHAARKARDRATRRGRLGHDGAELIVPWHVYRDDQWICYLCGDKVDKHKRHPHPQAPTLDHVIPLARGGLHVRENVRTAHSICNILKGDRG